MHDTESLTTFAIGGKEFTFSLPDTDDHIQRTIRETQAFHNLEILADMMIRIAPGDLVIDCGAGIGNLAIFLAGAADTTVIALEPFKHHFEILDRNIALNDLDTRILPVPMACGATATKGTIIPGPSHNLGQTRVATNMQGMGEEVTVIPLDELQLPAPVRLLSIDVTGMEADTLRGATRILTENSPTIYIEAQDEESLAELSEIVKPHNYVPAIRFGATSTYRFDKQ